MIRWHSLSLMHLPLSRAASLLMLILTPPCPVGRDGARLEHQWRGASHVYPISGSCCVLLAAVADDGHTGLTTAIHY